MSRATRRNRQRPGAGRHRLRLHDCADPAGRVGPLRHFLRPVLSHEETAAHQVEQLGFRRDDVRHIVVTHLDLDHIGGLSDFPHAQVHVTAAEALGAITSPSRFEKTRYRCAHGHTSPKSLNTTRDGEKWRGFAAAKELDEISPGIVLISLPGHTRGHACVAVDAGHRWVLHGGDSFFHDGTLDRHSHLPRALAAMETLIAFDRKMVQTTTPASQSSTNAPTPTYSSSALTTGRCTSELAHMRSGRPSDGTPMLNGAQALIRTLVDAGVTTCLGNYKEEWLGRRRDLVRVHHRTEIATNPAYCPLHQLQEEEPTCPRPMTTGPSQRR